MLIFVLIYLLIGLIIVLVDLSHTWDIPFYMFILGVIFWPIYLYYLIKYWNKI